MTEVINNTCINSNQLHDTWVYRIYKL